MIKLSYVVEPTNFERSVLEGSVRLTGSDLRNRELHAKAKRHIKRGTTLLSLATSIYIEQLDKEGIRIDPRQIRLDFKKLKEWEAINLKEEDSHWLPLWHRAGESAYQLAWNPHLFRGMEEEAMAKGG